jgi:poly-gamma-glutamate capsule biosynthesis protein CapA/YwtB (metallophosphatase superfamily)
MEARLVLQLAGDTMLGRGVNRVIRAEGPDYPLDPLAHITRAADLFFVNLESAISPADAVFSGAPKVFYFRADPMAVETLTHAGVDLVSLANNHALDADYVGLQDTLRILDEHGIAHAGAGENLDAAGRPAILEAQGLRLAVVGCCDHQLDFAAGVNQPGIRYADPDDPATAEALAAQVAALDQLVDHVIVAYHWQPNWAPEVKAFHRRLATQLVDAGGRLIWGHSPHHFQGVELLDHSAVLYSTGDFLDDYAVDPEFRNDRQLLFEIVLSERGVERVRAYPIELEFGRTVPATGEVRAWIVERFGEMCAQVGSRVEDDSTWLTVMNEQSTLLNEEKYEP